MDVDVENRFRMYRRMRQTFVIRTFTLATVFLLLALAQWIPILMSEQTDEFRKIFVEYFYISFIIFFCALLGVTVFVFFERIRYIKPLNWILTFLIVECVILGLARAVAESRIDHFAYSFIAVGAIVLITITVGAHLPRDLTLDVVILFISSMILFLAAIFCVMLHIIANIPTAIYFYIAFVFIIVIAFIMYHAQIIIGGRYADMKVGDYLLAALFIFHDFIILFVLGFYLASKIYSDNISQKYNVARTGIIINLPYNKSPNTTTTPPKSFKDRWWYG